MHTMAKIDYRSTLIESLLMTYLRMYIYKSYRYLVIIGTTVANNVGLDRYEKKNSRSVSEMMLNSAFYTTPHTRVSPQVVGQSYGKLCHHFATLTIKSKFRTAIRGGDEIKYEQKQRNARIRK